MICTQVRQNDKFDVHLYYIFDAIIPCLYHFFLHYGHDYKNSYIEGQVDHKRAKGNLLANAIQTMLEQSMLMNIVSSDQKRMLQLLIIEMHSPAKAIGVVTAPRDR